MKQHIYTGVGEIQKEYVERADQAIFGLATSVLEIREREGSLISISSRTTWHYAGAGFYNMSATAEFTGGSLMHFSSFKCRAQNRTPDEGGEPLMEVMHKVRVEGDLPVKGLGDLVRRACQEVFENETEKIPNIPVAGGAAE